LCIHCKNIQYKL